MLECCSSIAPVTDQQNNYTTERVILTCLMSENVNPEKLMENY